MNSEFINNRSIIKEIEEKWLKNDIPVIDVGDIIKIGILIQEGSKERVQFTGGVVIAKHKSNLNTTITVRKIIQGIGVERVYLIHSARIKYIRVVKKSRVRKAKLYYLRTRSGKATRLKQKFL